MQGSLSYDARLLTPNLRGTSHDFMLFQAMAPSLFVKLESYASWLKTFQAMVRRSKKKKEKKVDCVVVAKFIAPRCQNMKWVFKANIFFSSSSFFHYSQLPTPP